MKIPQEIIDQILGLSVVDSNIVYFWAYYPGIKRYVEENKELNWAKISSDQKLPECFIRAFKYQVDWAEIFFCQDLSREFLSRYDPTGEHSGSYEKKPILDLSFLNN